MSYQGSRFKRLPFYRELWQARDSLRYHRFWRYLANRFVAGPRLLRSPRPLDRPVDTDRYAIHLLCSHADVLPLVWALASWFAVSEDSAQVYIHDDGSFTNADRAALARLFPQARIVGYQAATERAKNETLKDFPSALARRLDRAHAYAIKLMDPIFTSQTPGLLIMDTDILWFEPPRDLHAHIANYPGAVFWPGSGEPTRQPFMDGTELRLDLAALNSGIVYFERAAFDVETLEDYCEKLPPEWPLLDQPGYAYVLGMRDPVTTLPVDRYHIHGAAHAGTVGKHYTGPRRSQFWFEGVERVKAVIGDR